MLTQFFIPARNLATWFRRSFVLGVALAVWIEAARMSALGAESQTPPVEPPPSLSTAPRFTTDVMPVLSKLGCNLGACHGNQNGKGGFKLSLRGQDPADDRVSISLDQFGRRVNLLEPAESLLLQKPTMQVFHEGGLRLRRGTPEYDVLYRWIAAGAPEDPADSPRLAHLIVEPAEALLFDPDRQQQISAIAEFSDGERRDVTSLAVYEPSASLVTVDPQGTAKFSAPGEATVLVRFLDLQRPVRLIHAPSRSEFVWSEPPVHNFIDEHAFAKLRRLRINPSPLAGDQEFVRRVYIDVLGILPTADEARSFVRDPALDKRARLIDRLLNRPEFAEHWALKWSDLLKNEEKVIDPQGVRYFHEWIRESFAAGKPLDQFVRELVTARGSTYANPAANFYRANRDPVSRAETAAQVFLGIRLQCAKCHNHPFDRWTQSDYYRWTAFFARVDYLIVTNNRPDDNDKHQFDGEQLVVAAPTGEVEDPRTKQPAPPKLLGGPAPALDGAADRLVPLADWIASPRNTMFVQAQVNRIWFHLMGRGLVDPIDDFRATNPAVNPPLLEALSAEFVASGFNVRHLVRIILNSRAYQLTAEPNESNRADELNFSRSQVRRLSAEQMLDALCQVTGSRLPVYGEDDQSRAGQAPGVGAFTRRDRRAKAAGDGEKFLRLFGKPPRLLTCECERATDSTLGQAFQMISGPALNRLLSDPHNRLTQLLAATESPGEMLDELYWAALAREPSPDERQALVAYVERSANWRQALEDVAWGLLNSKEFLLRR